MRMLICTLMLLITITGFTQTVEPPYEAGLWYGFKQAAVSYTFDDNTPNQFAIALPMFNEFDFNMTLFIVTDSNWEYAADWDILEQAAAQGHEIASHTVTHTSLKGMGDELQDIELKDSQETIEAHISNPKCITIAYPFCDVPKRSIFEKYYIAGRICSGSIIPSTPRDFMNISSIICGEERNFNNVSNFISRAESAVKSNGWCVYLLHGIDDDGGWSPVLSDTLRETLNYFKVHPDSFWVETFGNVVRYIKERDALSVSELSVQDDHIQIQVTDTLDNTIFNVPVTLRRPFPEGWLSATAEQNGQSVETRIVEIDAIKYVQFDAVPDAGDVVLQKSNETTIHRLHGLMDSAPALLKHYPNPFNPTATIQYRLIHNAHVRLSVYNLLGQEIRVLVDEEQSPGMYDALFNGADLASGIYFSKLFAQSENGQGHSTVQKMILSW